MRSVKCEEKYLKHYESVPEATQCLSAYFTWPIQSNRRRTDFYNTERPHQSLGNKTPEQAFFA